MRSQQACRRWCAVSRRPAGQGHGAGWACPGTAASNVVSAAIRQRGESIVPTEESLDGARADSTARQRGAERPGLFSDERQDEILALIRSEKRVSVASLAERFAVVGETIRRDLADLEHRGLIRRVHGGAIPVERVTFEPPIEARHDLMRPEKERIALAALAELPSEGSVFIEAGSTNSFLAGVLPPDCSLTIVTNGGYIATALARHPSLTVLAVGGRVRPRSLACVDDWALETLSRLRVTVAFLGTNGISVENGLTTPDPAEAAVKRAMLTIAQHTVLLADHSKIGVASLLRYGDVDQIHTLITDSGLPSGDLSDLQDAGLRVVRA
jgi:DeoR family fructose operon transcriptional repressor